MESIATRHVSFGNRAGRAARGGLRGFLFAGVVVAGLMAGAACASADGRAVMGTKGAACYPNGTCDDGLSCASDLCVVLDGPEDAAKTPSDDAAKTTSDDAGMGKPAATCMQGERATDFASCTSDDECFSGNCCKRGMPGCGKQGDYPGYCVHPNTTAYKNGHGYSCDTDADCAAVAPDFIARGGRAHCYKDNVNNVPNGCGFDCSSPTHDPTVTSNGGGPASGAGGAPGTAGATGAGGSTQSAGGPPSGVGGSAQSGGGGPSGAGGSAPSGGGRSGAGGSAPSGGGPSGIASGTQGAGGASAGAGGSAQSGGGGPSGVAGGTSSASGGHPGAGGGTQSGGGASSGAGGTSSHT